MTEEQQQLIRIIANQLFGVKVDIEDVTDWYSIMKEAHVYANLKLSQLAH